MDKIVSSAGCVALGAASCTQGLAEESNTTANKIEHPNIVLIFSDEIDFSDLRKEEGVLGTPHLKRLAREGMTYNRAYCTSPMCTPSRFSVISGTYPSRCAESSFVRDSQAGEIANIAWNSHIHSDCYTLPRMLSAAGYVTGMTGKWHLGPDSPAWNNPIKSLDRIDTPEAQQILSERQQQIASAICRDAGFDEALGALWENFDAEPIAALQHHNIPWITKNAVRFIEKKADGDKPFFLYVAATTIHGPRHQDSLDKDLTFTPGGHDDDVKNFLPDREKISQAIAERPLWEKHRRTGMVELDTQVGAILDALERKGISEKTIVIYMPDHNIEPGKATCYEKGYRVPMIIRWPGKIAAGSNTDVLFQGVDFFAMFAKLIGSPATTPDSLPIDIIEPGQGMREVIYYESGYTRAVRVGKWKYIAWRPKSTIIEAMCRGEKTGCINYLDKKWQSHSQVALMLFPSYFDQDQLFDLESDPGEQHNLAKDPTHAETLESMQTLLRKKLDTFPTTHSLAKIPFLDSPEFAKLAAEQKARGTDFIPWLATDHGTLTTIPPKSEF